MKNNLKKKNKQKIPNVCLKSVTALYEHFQASQEPFSTGCHSLCIVPKPPSGPPPNPASQLSCTG